MISIVDFIIMTAAINVCIAVIVGTVVYRLLKKKHDEDTDWLLNEIQNNKTEVSRLYNLHLNHLIDYHNQED
jgi:uncharacterized membrane-anchored protein YhcB (DUF1043 family)